MSNFLKIIAFFYLCCSTNSKLNIFTATSNLKCSASTHDNESITKECNDAPSYDRMLQYRTFDEYVLDHEYDNDGLIFLASLYLDTNSHDFGEFFSNRTGIIILTVIIGIFIIIWIPLLFCWKERCGMFDDCINDIECCFIFWNILTYFLFAAAFSFIIVCIIFGT